MLIYEYFCIFRVYLVVSGEQGSAAGVLKTHLFYKHRKTIHILFLALMYLDFHINTFVHQYICIHRMWLGQHTNHLSICLYFHLFQCLPHKLFIDIFSICRVYLGYHTSRQVVWGAAAGAISGPLWFIVVQFVFTPFFPVVAAW